MLNIIDKNKINIERALDFVLQHKKIFVVCAVMTVIAVFFVCKSSNDKISMDVGEFKGNSLEANGYGDFAVTADDVEIIYNSTGNNASGRTSVLIEDSGRADPFLPDGEVSSTRTESRIYTSSGADLLPPPETITTDTTATEVMTTKVSGLMYDKTSPSAIININNSDYLVRVGDVINDYKVLSIGQNTVTVQYGANIYKAGVGELFTGEGINYNTISNLEGKFGGAKNSVNRKQ